MLWLITDKGDPDARRLVDGVGFGKPHYSRQQPGTPSFTRNGQNLVFITADGLAAWVTFRPTPGKAERKDKLDAWECALFRNEGPHLSSLLIREAEELSVALWGQLPRDGFITFVRGDKVRSTNPGCCYKKAGWAHIGFSPKGYYTFRAPPRPPPRPFWEWQWKEGRGGKLRKMLEGVEELVA